MGWGFAPNPVLAGRQVVLVKTTMSASCIPFGGNLCCASIIERLVYANGQESRYLSKNKEFQIVTDTAAAIGCKRMNFSSTIVK